MTTFQSPVRSLAAGEDPLVASPTGEFVGTHVGPVTGNVTGLVTLPRTSVAAAGSTNADAAALSAGYNIVTGADATKGVILPAAVAGRPVWVKNGAAAVLKVYPPSGAAINGLTATTGAISMAANTFAIFMGDSATQVYTLPLLPS